MFPICRDSCPSWVIVGNPRCRRVAFFQAALRERGWPPATLVSYSELLRGCVALRDLLSPGCFVRIESAAEEWETRQLLLERGYASAVAEGYPAATTAEIAVAPNDAGILLWPRQLFLGFADLLGSMHNDLQAMQAQSLNVPADIITLFDKPTCQRRFHATGVAVPTILGEPRSYREVRELSQRNGRTMLKLAHGSGGAGCVALHWHRGRVRALTSLRWTEVEGKRWGHSSQRVRQILDEVEIAEVVDYVCGERAHLEKWLPKARCEFGEFDLRIVTIGGEVRHVVPRVSNSPFTNLNLGNRRGDFSVVAQKLTPQQWSAICDTCVRVASQFSNSLYLGIDLLLTPRGEHFVLEANAFGDLLPGILSQGQETYAAEIEQWEQRQFPNQDSPKPTATVEVYP